jgi:hypothetical protein
MGSTPSVPSLGDDIGAANSLAATQQNYNLQALESGEAASLISQSTPYGTLNFSQTGTGPNGVPTYSATEQLSPQEQSLLNLQQNIQGGLGTIGGSFVGTTADIPSLYSGAPNLIGPTNSLTNQMLSNEVSSLEPYFQVQNEQLNSQLTAEGLNNPNNQAYQQAQMDLQGTQNQAVEGFLTQAQPTAFGEATTNYQIPLTTAQAIQSMGLSDISGLSVPNLNQQTVSTPNEVMQPTNLPSLLTSVGNINQANYADQLQAQTAMLSGLFGLGGSAAGALGNYAGLSSIAGALAV